MTDVERQLHGLSDHLEWPATPDVSPIVGARIQPARRRVPRLVPALATALVVVVLVLAIPAARDAVEAFFGIGGVTIEEGSLLDPGVETDLGEPVDPGDLDLELPHALGEPDGARVDPEGRIWILYSPRDGQEGALLTVFDTVRTAGLTKLATDASIQVDQVVVNGSPAYWVTGDDHFIMFELPNGRIAEDRGRLSAPALIWVDGATTFRLESDVSLDRAVEIAESIP